MAILEKEVWVQLHPQTISRYDDLGYRIPRYLDNNGIPRVKKGQKIKVLIDDLPSTSMVKITKVCDFCKREIFEQQYSTVVRCRNSGDGKDRCRKCGGKKISETMKSSVKYENSLHAFALDNGKKGILSEYSSKNKIPLTKVSKSDNDLYIWNCSRCGSEYKMSPNSKIGKNRYSKCPYCSGHRVNHTNSLSTTHPHISKLLLDKRDGDKISHGSKRKLKFICPSCKDVQEKTVVNVVRQGFGCLVCSDGISYSEKILISMLTQLDVEFLREEYFEWSENRRYDFFIPSINCIIESNGLQHYERGFKGIGGRTLEEEQENDRVKKSLAIKNGIEHYIVVDSRKSNLDWMKNNVICSELSNIFNINKIDWSECERFASNSLIYEVCELYESGIRSFEDIGKFVGLSRSTVYTYLKKGVNIGICSYNPQEIKNNLRSKAHKKSLKKIIQLNKKGGFINEWGSLTEASWSLDIGKSSICSNLKGNYKTAGGYKWMYKEDYDKYIQEQNQKSKKTS